MSIMRTALLRWGSIAVHEVQAHAQTPYFRVPRSTYTSVPSTNALVSGRSYISNSFSSTYICSSFEKKRSNLPTVAALASLRPVYSANRPQKTSGFQEVQAIRAYARSGGMPMQGITAPATTSSAGGVRLMPYMQSPMVIAEPYKLKPKFTPAMLASAAWWKSRGSVLMSMVRSMYCMAKCTKHIKGFSRKQLKESAGALYEEINKLQASGSQSQLRQNVTEVIYSQLKREMKQREVGGWAKVDWHLVELKQMDVAQARLVAPNQTDLENAFVQFTMHFQSQQRFAAYNAKGELVAGDPERLINVEDYWVLERSLSQANARWRLAGRISI
mmetsp:Transcript_22481/g.37580  ORF Transcript_22481/g.37580 Transcript_22481/m.37580 type:complete len:330 (+) Transcript_22481:114-1103(+)